MIPLKRHHCRSEYEIISHEIFNCKYYRNYPPYQGYRSKDKHSLKGLKRWRYMSDKYGVHIVTADNGTEARIGAYKVDGYCKRTVFEFNVCTLFYTLFILYLFIYLFVIYKFI